MARPIYSWSAEAKYQPEWSSLEQHPLPSWYANAKLGIFIHWGLYSVPAWAPPSGEVGKVDWSKWFYNNAYAEWYLNTLRLKGSPTYEHHLKTYGADFDYYQFAKTFNEETKKWDPNAWASLFKKIGARYAVLTTKHHDGFRLWPSKVQNPHANGRDLSASRDLVGELTKAVHRQGLHMGLYYSGGLDWTFTSEPIATMKDLRDRIPQTEEYAAYADTQWNELVNNYNPAVLWNDIGYPKLGKVPELFAHFYNDDVNGVVNNRFSAPFADFTTPEYAKYDKITPKKWETCRGLGFSFGYNQVEGPEQVIKPEDLIALFVDIVSKNGNLLLNIGPKPNGSISDIQMDRLNKLGAWLEQNGEGIFDTKPWVKPSATAPDGSEVRFTTKDDALYAYFVKRPQDGEWILPGVRITRQTSLSILGSREKLAATSEDSGVKIAMKSPEHGYAVGVKLAPVPEAA